MGQSGKRRGAWSGLLATLLLTCGPLSAAAPIALEDLARAPAVRTAMLDPAGARVATIETLDGRGAVFLHDLATGERTLVHQDPERSIGNIAWSGDGRWLYFFQDRGGDEGYHLFRLDPLAAGAALDLTPFPGVVAEAITTSGVLVDRVLVALNRRDPERPDAFSVELDSGTVTELVRNDGSFVEYFADGQGRVGAATAILDDGTLELWARTSARPGWTRTYAAAADERFKVLALLADGSAAIARSDRGRAQEVLVRIDLDSGMTRRAGRHRCGRFDVEHAVVGATGIELVACVGLKADVAAPARSLRRPLAEVRRKVGLQTGLWLESRAADDSAVMFYSDASDRPGRFWLYTHAGGARSFAASRPWLENHRLARSQPTWFEARDGLPLLAYVTRPPGETKAGPAVIAIHGGPWTRDSGGFEAETQLLASRGYTVVQVNFRSSTGLGRRTWQAGVRQFGRAMSDDIDDAHAWAAGKGLIDPARTCLLGGSYGGYAVLVGLTRSPTRYRCGVEYAGPVDLATLVESFPPSWRPYLPRSWHRFVGNPDIASERREMDAHSPLHAAGRIVRPLLVFQGANDPRVTQAQSDTLVCSLRKRGVPVDYLLAGNEGHSFGNEATSLAVNRAVELFLARHLGGPFQLAVPASVDSVLAGLREAGDTVGCPAQPRAEAGDRTRTSFPDG